MSGEELQAALEAETKRMGIALNEVFVMNHIDQSRVISWDALAAAVIRTFIRPADPRVPALASPSTPEPSGKPETIDQRASRMQRERQARVLAGKPANVVAAKRAGAPPSTPEPSGPWPCCTDATGMPVPCQHRALDGAAPSTEPALDVEQARKAAYSAFASAWADWRHAHGKWAIGPFQEAEEYLSVLDTHPDAAVALRDYLLARLAESQP